MRLVTLDSREVGGRPGVWLKSGEILDLAVVPDGLAAAQWRPQSVVSVLAAGDEGAARVSQLISQVESAGERELQQWRAARRLLPAGGTQLLTPIRRPGLLLMLPSGVERGADAYLKNPNAASGPEARVIFPSGKHDALHALGMLGLVIGKPLFQGGLAEATRSIAAITLVADLGSSPREPGHTLSRQFPGACVIGPALVTLDEFPAAASWSLRPKINGHSVVSGAASIALPAAAAAVASLSAHYAFRPGDIVAVAFGIPELPLGAGDRLRMALDPTLELGFSVAHS